MMTGQGTLVTFDKRVFTVTEPGTFLLTKDYRQNNFTVLMSSNDRNLYDLVIVTRSALVYIDLYKEVGSVRILLSGLPKAYLHPQMSKMELDKPFIALMQR